MRYVFSYPNRAKPILASLVLATAAVCATQGVNRQLAADEISICRPGSALRYVGKGTQVPPRARLAPEHGPCS